MKLMLGNEAVARGLYEAGVKTVSSYPGTPSTEITESVSQYPEIYTEWAPNEKVAFEVAFGASLAGARSFSGMKHVGLNVAADPLYTASYTGVNGGLVVAVADDSGMHSSQNEQDSRHHARASKVVMLEPADSQECLNFTKMAFTLSERFDTPVLLRLSTRISHSQTLVETGEREEKENIPYQKNAAKYIMMPGYAKVARVKVEERIQALTEFASNCPFNKIIEGGDIGVIANGPAYQYAREALGSKATYLKLGMVYPLPVKLITDFAKRFSKVYVLEELEPIIEEHCRALGLTVLGKSLFSNIGEYSANKIAEVILNEKRMYPKSDKSVPNRPPVLCVGCPHRATYSVIKKLKLNVFGDIGCYTLGAVAPLSALDTTLCMGSSISSLHGFNVATENKNASKSVAVIGDSTFMHTGINSLANIAYNKGVSTVMILDNRTTGMTGHQNNPVNGLDIRGNEAPAVDLAALCKALGINRVFECDPFDLNALEMLLKQELALNEPSVIIVKSPCALLKTYKAKAPLRINDKCTKCKQCLAPGCPAISMKDGKIFIDKTQCNGCMLCQKICKFSAIEVANG